MKDVATELDAINSVIEAGPFAATWESLEDYRVPKWYRDAKFGIFIHWGVYSVPAFGNEWYPRSMYLKDNEAFAHHRETWGDHTEFGYKDFIPLFKAEHFNAEAWAGLFAEAGAKYVVPVAEHHDGFAMYDSGFSKWCATQMGPKRDVIGELAAATRERNMVFGLSTHREEHCWFFNGGRDFDSDVQDDQWRDLYGPAHAQEVQPEAAFLDDWLARTCELVDKYQPQLVWFDWWINQPAYTPYLKQFAAYYYNRGERWDRCVAINYKNEAYPQDAAVFDMERGQLAQICPTLWQNDTSICKKSWGYIEDHDYKTPTAIIGDLVDVISKNGALLLNVCPRPDGTIPEPQQDILREVGRWLDVNGEAVYGTRPWKVFGEGPTEVVEGGFCDTKRETFTSEDIRFTRKGEALYAIALGWPKDGRLRIKTFVEGSIHAPHRIADVALLGSDAPLKWTRDKDSLTIDLPTEPPCAHASALRIR